MVGLYRSPTQKQTVMRLLLVEDDQGLVTRLKKDFEANGYVVDHADNGIDGQYLGETEAYDLVILDLGLPGRPGLDILHNWRESGLTLPVILLTARDAWHERVEGFRFGADDYVGKPFHFEELLERTKALIRRSNNTQNSELHTKGLSLDEERQCVLMDDGRTIDLTGTEFRLLRYFLLHKGKILSKSTLTEHIYDRDFDRDSNVIEVYVRHLRNKLGDEWIQTRRGQGYVFAGGEQ